MGQILTSPTIPLGPITRRRLHELVWSIPRSRLAAAFGITDVALGKLCRTRGVPAPPRGWWARQAAGSRAKPTALPSKPGSFDPDEVVFTVPDPATAGRSPEPDVAAALERLATLPATAIETGSKPDPNASAEHPVAALARKALEAGKRTKTPSPLAIHVSATGLDRALDVANRLLRALAHCGFETAVHDEPVVRPSGQQATAVYGRNWHQDTPRVPEPRTRTMILGEAVEFVIWEITPASATIDDRRAATPEPTPLLVIEMPRPDDCDTLRRWSDGAKPRLDSMIPRVAREANLNAQEVRRDRLKQEEWQRRWREQREAEAREQERVAGSRSASTYCSVRSSRANWHYGSNATQQRAGTRSDVAGSATSGRSHWFVGSRRSRRASTRPRVASSRCAQPRRRCPAGLSITRVTLPSVLSLSPCTAESRRTSPPSEYIWECSCLGYANACGRRLVE